MLDTNPKNELIRVMDKDYLDKLIKCQAWKDINADQWLKSLREK